MITKELKNKEINKTLKTLNEINEMENKKILEMINIFKEIYDISKTKNYRIIMNILDNIDFNLERIKFGKDSSKENDVNLLSASSPSHRRRLPLELSCHVLVCL